MESHHQFYVDKKILAPMVRVGTLPMRLLALDYGAGKKWRRYDDGSTSLSRKTPNY
jgi:tRNA-dihydrouridine synthase